MKIIDKFKAAVLKHTCGARKPAGVAPFQLSTRGGTIAVSSDFSISYAVCDYQPCQLSNPSPSDKFALTLIQSPSGSGKTTMLRELYAHIHRQAGPSKLNFDFHPDFTEECRIACGFVPQHPPLVKHWICNSLLPATPLFLDVFFSDFSEKDREALPSKRVGELSGGQARRLLACSAVEELCSDYEESAVFLLLDETFDGIGAEHLVECLNGLRRKWLDHGKRTLHVLLVSHLSRNEVNGCLLGHDLVVAMDVMDRQADRLETRLRNVT